MFLFFKNAVNNVLNFCFPSLCSGCSTILFNQELHICLKCQLNLPKTNFKNQDNNYAANIFKGRIPIVYATSYLYFRKKGIAQNLVHQIKYKKNLELGKYLGQQFGMDILEQIKNNPPDIITCVPLHKKKLKLRGYNQSESIATGISESLNIPFNPNIILKLTHSDSQTKKSRFNRWLNVDTKFILNPAFDIKNKHVLIVDDVITTGATIETCGQLVLSQENTKTSFLSLCLSTN
jgi:ComF family protein